MPSDTYILTISEAGVSTPSNHASTHLTGGSDAIPVASTSTSGLMSPTIFDQHVVNNAKISNKTHTGDVTDNNGELTLTKINGVSLSSLGTGILRMASGTPSIATAEQFPTLNQSTTGNADTATTATNIAGGSVGSIPYQTGSGATTMLAAGTSGYVLKSNGSAAPSWSAINLSSGTSGTLPVSAGGTGVTTLAAGIVKSNGTSQFQRVDAPTGDIVGTTDTQTLTNKTMGSGTSFSSAIPVQYGGTGLATITGYVKGSGTAPLSTSDTIPVADISGILPIAKGGTGYGSDGIGTLSFDTTPDIGTALTEGQLRWNTGDKTLDLKMTGTAVTQQIGQELLMRVHATTAITNGDLVYISGSNTDITTGITLPAISKAIANDTMSKKTLAMATENISSGSDGYITLYGLVRGLNLNSYSSGQELWLSPTTAGVFTSTEPSYPNYKIRVGYVISATDGTGTVYVSPRFYENGTVNGTGKIGYLTGSGDAETQNTSKSTDVTLNKTNGQITMHDGSLAQNTSVSFILTNSKIEAGDILITNHISGGTLGNYLISSRSAAGSATINVRNVSGGSLSDAVVIAFAVIKAVNA